MTCSTEKSGVAALTVIVVTTAAFAKTFVPFYRMGSTSIFVITCLLGLSLIAVRWREILSDAKFAKDLILTATAFYACVIGNYLVFSSGQVPASYLVGILAFHGLFLVFGFTAARSLSTVSIMLLLQGAIYVIVIVHYIIVYGDPMHGGFLQDIFNIRVETLSIALHQHIGNALSLALLAILGFESKRTRLSAFIATPLLLLFMFHIAARAALVALLTSLLFCFGANLWVRSKRTAILLLAIVTISALVASRSFYAFAIQDKDVTATASDAISRTIRELQSHDPGFRMQIWQRAWKRIEADPQYLLFGRGIGSYSIDEGFGPPTWLLDKSPKHYPHNTLLEMLYETGITGLLIFSFLILLPLLIALSQWSKFCAQDKAAISMYVFYLASSQLSGAFVYDYSFQFFFAIAVGVVGRKRAKLTEHNSEELPPPICAADH